MFDNDLKIAYEKSDEVLQHVVHGADEMINTSDVLSYVQKNYCPDIDVISRSFDELGVKKPYGAMMLIEFNSDEEKKLCKPSRTIIVLNKDRDAIFQRFSLLHELGHLVTLDKDNLIPTENYVVSTHIDYKITNISEEEYKKNRYLLKEQIANIFALRVLMPSNQFYNKMQEFNDISKVAKFFGLTKDAVISRMMIGA